MGSNDQRLLLFDAALTIKRAQNEIARLRQALAEPAMLEAEAQRLRNLLEDVVNELDLSESMCEKHGPRGTPPAEIVREVLDHKDRIITMLRQRFVDAGSPPAVPDAVRVECGQIANMLADPMNHAPQVRDHAIAEAIGRLRALAQQGEGRAGWKLVPIEVRQVSGMMRDEAEDCETISEHHAAQMLRQYADELDHWMLAAAPDPDSGEGDG